MNDLSDEIITEIIDIDDPQNESTCSSIVNIISINIILILIIASKCFKQHLERTTNLI